MLLQQLQRYFLGQYEYELQNLFVFVVLINYSNSWWFHQSKLILCLFHYLTSIIIKNFFIINLTVYDLIKVVKSFHHHSLKLSFILLFKYFLLNTSLKLKLLFVNSMSLFVIYKLYKIYKQNLSYLQTLPLEKQYYFSPSKLIFFQKIFH